MTNDSAADDWRGRLTEVRHSLLRLHKNLLESERAAYEGVHGRIESPYQFFGLVTGHQWFAWLRQLSALIVQIDEGLAAKDPPLAPETANDLTERTRALLSPSEADDAGEFAKKYHAALQRDPETVLAHAETMKLLR